MKKIILIFFLMTGCAYEKSGKINNFSNLNFSKELSFEEFKINLEKYSNNSPYPNIDN